MWSQVLWSLPGSCWGRTWGCRVTCCEVKEGTLRKQSERCAMTLENHNYIDTTPWKRNRSKTEDWLHLGEQDMKCPSSHSVWAVGWNAQVFLLMWGNNFLPTFLPPFFPPTPTPRITKPTHKTSKCFVVVFWFFFFFKEKKWQFILPAPHPLLSWRWTRV